MSFKRYPEHQSQNLVPVPNQAMGAPSPVVAHYETPSQAPSGKGKSLIAILILAFVGYGVYHIWDNYFRYEAHGIVDANIIGVYSAEQGLIQSLGVKPGDTIKKDDPVAHVVNSNNTRDLQQIADEITVAEAELRSRTSELSQKLALNQEIYYKALGELRITEADLGDYRARLVAAELNVERNRRLKKKGAASSKQVEEAIAEAGSLKARFESTKKAVEALQTRVANSNLIVTMAEDQLAPYEQRLQLLRNQHKRLRDKIKEGLIHSPVNGRVSKVNRFAGERINGEPIFDIVENGTFKIVLYFRANEKLPKVDDKIPVWSTSLGYEIMAKVVGLSKDTAVAPDQIQVFYSRGEKLVRVYLEPIDIDFNQLVVGTIVKKEKDIPLINSEMWSELWQKGMQLL